MKTFYMVATSIMKQYHFHNVFGSDTLKGFILGGTVTKLTPKFVFYDDGSGMIRRKGYNGVVVPSGEQE